MQMVGLGWGPDTRTSLTLCTIRKPFVWHRDRVPSASGNCPVDHMEMSVDLESSRPDESRMSDDYSTSSDNDYEMSINSWERSEGDSETESRGETYMS